MYLHGMRGQQNPRSDCASVQSIRSLSRLLPESLDTNIIIGAHLYFTFVSLFSHFNLYHSLGTFSRRQIHNIYSNFFQENRLRQLIQIVTLAIDILNITKTYLYNFYPLKPHFYIVKLGFTGVYIIFPISAQNIDCGYSLEPPRRGGSNEYSQSMFRQKYEKYQRFFYLKIFSFWR